MPEQIFSKSVNDFKAERVRDALAEVAQLSDDEILDEALPATLDRIVSKAADFLVAELNPEKKRGTRRKERGRRRDSFGEMSDYEVSVIDVAIPLSGHPSSVYLRPTHCEMMSTHNVRIESGKLIVTMYDDENLEAELGGIVSTIEKNLGQLRRDLAGFEAEVRKPASDAAERRRRELEQQKERDSRRSFPID